MAKREFNVTLVGTVLNWLRVGAAVNAPAAFSFDAATVHESLRERVYAYGVKQIIADGGALDRNASAGERLAMMEKRANALRDGTWGTRIASAPTITTDSAIVTLANGMGKTVEEVRAMLGMEE